MRTNQQGYVKQPPIFVDKNRKTYQNVFNARRVNSSNYV